MKARRTGFLLVSATLAAVLFAAGCSLESRKAKHAGRAAAYLAEGKLDRAEIEYLNVLKLDPKAPGPVGKLGLIYFEQGQLGRALPYLARAIELDPNDLEARTKLASLLLSVGNRTQASGEAERILEHDPVQPEALVILAECATTPEDFKKVMDRVSAETLRDNAAACVARGIVLAKEGKLEESMTALKKAVERDEKFAPAHSALAALYVALDQKDLADRAFARAAELSGPRSPRTLQYALFKGRSGDLEGARRILEEVIRKAPDYVPAVLRLADVMASEGHYAQAEAMLQPILDRVPNHPEALLVRSRIYLAEGRPDKAGVDVDLLTRMYPNSPDAHFESARVFIAKKDMARALDSLHLAIEANPDYWEAILLKARVHLEQGETVVAVKLLTEMLGRQPRNAQALMLLAEAYRAQKNFNAALEACDTLEHFHPNREPVALLRGELLRQLSRPAEARAAFEEALVRNPDSLRAVDELVILDVQDRHMDQAVARVQAAIARRPDEAGLRITLGKLNLIRKDPAKAEEALRKAVELDPKTSLGHVLLARLYLDTNRTDLAIESLGQVMARNPRDEGAAMLLASLQEKRGDIEAARKTYEDLIREVPNAAPALNNLACLLEKHTKELERAYELARRARELLPGDPQVADTLGWILYRKSEYKLAAAMLRENVASNPTSGLAHYRLGAALYMLGNEKEASQEFQAATKAGLSGPELTDSGAMMEILRMRVGGVGKVDDSALQAHIAAHPEDPMALITRGDVALSRGQFDAAMESFRGAVGASPQNGLAQVGMARTEFARGNVAKAMDFAREGRRMMPENVDALILLGRVAYAAKDFTWANTLLHDAFRQRPTDAAVALDAAWAAYSQGLVEEALRDFAVGLGQPGRKDLEEQVALMRARTGANVPADAVVLAKRRLAAHPEEVPALMVVAGTADAEESEKALQTVLKVFPEFSPAKRELALLLARQQEKADQRVIPLASQALETYPGDPVLIRVLALATGRQGRYEVALPLLERALERNRNDAPLWYYLGLARLKLSGKDSARAAFEKSLEGTLPADLAQDAKKRLEGLAEKVEGGR
ncbi:MAG: tetratricopeptide repeat protein [Opitutaceae bacterium]|nr:tetratricopeptide repeat protein [Opitutaceae bacterium]